MRRSQKASELREQIRTDIRESGERAAEAVTDVPAGSIVLSTPHVATVVRVADIAEVATVRPDRRTLGLYGLVTMHNGDRYHVPEARPVVDAMKAAAKDRRAC